VAGNGGEWGQRKKESWEDEEEREEASRGGGVAAGRTVREMRTWHEGKRDQ
jgi:hypothetical protein